MINQIIKYVASILLFTSCAATHNNNANADVNNETQSKQKVYISTPTRDDFVPLAPPVVVKGAPEDYMQDK